MATKTFKELIEVQGVIFNMYQKDETLKDTKFGYAWNKFYDKNIAETFKQYQERLQDLYLNQAMEDEKGKVVLDKESKTSFAHTKAQWREVFKGEKTIVDEFDAKEIEIQPYTSPFVPPLNDEQTEVLSGLII